MAYSRYTVSTIRVSGWDQEAWMPPQGVSYPVRSRGWYCLCLISHPLTPMVLTHLHASLYFSLLPSYFCFMAKCPTCGKSVEWKDNPWRPFCSERCKLIDFDKWTSEEYRVPGRRINPAEIDHPSRASVDENGDAESHT